MRILFCQSVPYLPQDQGGALSNTDALCRRLQMRGHEVSVLAKARRGPGPLPQVLKLGEGKSDRLGYPVQRVHDPLAAARSICCTHPPHLAIIQLGDIAGLCHVFSEAGIPSIAYIHDIHSLPVNNIGISSSAVRYAACSQFVASWIRKRVDCEAPVIPVLIEPSCYRTVTERRVVTFVNPIPRKGAEIVFALAAHRPDIPFEFIEAWRLRNRVKSYLAARAAHHGNIRFIPNTSDMRPIYSRSRVVIAPSLYDEAWGRVVSEAQINTIPALASNSGGLPEAVGPGGLVVDRYAPIYEWLSALSSLWDNIVNYNRLSEYAASHAARLEFQPDAIVDRALSVFFKHAGMSS